MHLSAAITTSVLLPLLFIELRRLAPLSMLGSAATALVLCMVLGLLVIDPHREAMPQQLWLVRGRSGSGVLWSLETGPHLGRAAPKVGGQSLRLHAAGVAPQPHGAVTACPPAHVSATSLPLVQPPPQRHLVSRGIIQACGIFALSCSAHSALPALRR